MTIQHKPSNFKIRRIGIEKLLNKSVRSIHIHNIQIAFFACFVLLCSFVSKTAYADNVLAETPILWMTEDYPPYNYVDENGVLAGISVEILLEIMARNKVAFGLENIAVMPWARAYKEILANNNSALFSMDMTKTRKDLFTFVGPIAPSKVSIFTLRQDMEINSIEELSELNVGVVRNDVGEQLLDEQGIAAKAKVKLPSSLEMMRMLKLGRIDAVAIAEDIARFHLRKLGINKGQYKIHFTLHDSYTNFAFNKNVPEKFIQAFKLSLKELHDEGFVQQAYIKHTKSE